MSNASDGNHAANSGHGGVQTSPLPGVRALTAGDVARCLKAGIADFAKAPLPGLLIGSLFALIGGAIVLGLTVLDMPWMGYPFAIGFPLIGPFAAAGLYEVSRRQGTDEPVTLGAILGAMWAQRRRELGWMAFVMLFVFWVWMYQIRLLIALFLGLVSFASFGEFLTIIFTTQQGLLFLGVGHLVGALLAMVLFSITVCAMPLLMDREIDIVSAMITSVRAVMASPYVMLGWGVMVTLSLLAASLPLFAGLVVVLPVLGHATWHIYLKAVEPETA